MALSLYRRLLASAFGAGIYGCIEASAMAGVPVSPLLVGIGSMAGATFGSIAANAVDTIDSKRLGQAKDILANHDLRQVVGNTIGIVLERAANKKSLDEPDRKALLKLSKFAIKQWTTVMYSPTWSEKLADVQEAKLAESLAAARKDASNETSLTPEIWSELLEDWAVAGKITLPKKACRLASQRLTNELLPAIPELLKDDAAKEGKAFAGYQIQVYSHMLTKLDALEVATKYGVSQGDMEQVRAWLQQLYDRLDEKSVERLNKVWQDLQNQFIKIIDQLNRMEGKIDILVQAALKDVPNSLQSKPDIRQPDQMFVGRQNLIGAIIEAATSGAYLLYNTVGLGGVGKTELAYKVADKLQQEFPERMELNFQGYSEGAEPLSAEAALRQVVTAFAGHDQELPDDPEALAQIYRGAFGDRKVLLLCDNVLNGSQLKYLKPPPRGWFVLVTSRDRLPEFGPASTNVSCLERHESIDLLQLLFTHLGPSQEECDLLADACADHAQTLRLAAADAVDESLSPAEQAELIVRARTAWEADNTDSTEDSRPLAAFEGTISVSLSRLNKEERTAWQKCAVFTADFDAPAAAAVLGLESEAKARRVLGKLVARSLLEQDIKGRYRMHDLVRTVARRQLVAAGEEHPTSARYVTYYLQLLDATNDLYGIKHDVQGLAVFDREAVHFQSLAFLLENQAESTEDAEGASAEQWLQFLSWGCHIFPLRFGLSEYARMLEGGVALAKRTANQVMVAKLAGNLGLIYRVQGDLTRAEQMHQQALELNKDLGRKEGMANQLGNLGVIYQTQGDLTRAEQMHQQSLAIETELGRKEGMANQLGNLGLIYRVQGDLTRAEQMHQQALELNKDLGRKEGMANQLGNLGVIYQTQGDLTRAEQMHQQALELNKELGRKEGMAADYGNLGTLRVDQGRQHEARVYWLQSRDLFAKLGAPHMVERVQNLLDGLDEEE